MVVDISAEVAGGQVSEVVVLDGNAQGFDRSFKSSLRNRRLLPSLRVEEDRTHLLRRGLTDAIDWLREFIDWARCGAEGAAPEPDLAMLTGIVGDSQVLPMAAESTDRGINQESLPRWVELFGISEQFTGGAFFHARKPHDISTTYGTVWGCIRLY